MKRIFDFIPAHILGLYILGVLTQYNFSLVPNFYFGIMVLFTVLIFFRFLFKRAVVLVMFCVGMLTMYLHEEQKLPLPKTKEYYQFTISEILKSNNSNQKYYANDVFFEGKKLRNKILVSVSKKGKIFKVGDAIAGYGLLDEISSPKNPFDFDYKDYLKKKNVHAQLYLIKGTSKIISKNKFHPIRIANGWRNYLSENLKRNITDENSIALTEAMLLGKRNKMSVELLQSFADAGVIHVLAVSGLHVGILLLLLSFLLKPLNYFRNGKIVRLVLLVIGLWSFALLAGLSSSVVRAVTMFSFVAVGMVLNKKNSVFRSLITSALVLLLINPFYLFDVGFQMSYLAVFSIVWIQPMLYSIWKPKFKATDYFWKLITVSLAAQIGVLPISLFYFHQFPALFLVTNTVIIPVVGFVLVYGVGVLILSQFENTPDIIFSIYSYVLKIFTGFIDWISGFEKAVFKDIYFSESKLWMSYLLLLSVFLFIERKKWMNLKIMLAMVVLFQLVFISEKIHQNDVEEFIICNRYKTSLFIENKKNKVTFLSKDSIIDSKVVLKYLGQQIGNNEFSISKIPKVFKFQNELFFVVDNNSVYDIEEFSPTIVCLQNSPKINLERLLLKLKPKKIIADGSNYKYLKEKWKKTCNKHNVAFYDTQTQGAYVQK